MHLVTLILEMKRVFFILNVHSLTFYKSLLNNIQIATILLKCHSKYINNGTEVKCPQMGNHFHDV